MSWDREKHKATCLDCGTEGFCIQATDDWNRSSTTWIGFENIKPDAQAVARKRVDARNSRPQCSCGSTNIEIGEPLGACDHQGNIYD